MHTETNNRDSERNEEAQSWLERQWANLARLKEDGVPLMGFTCYSLTGQADRDSLLAEDNGRVNRFGLLDLERRNRPVGEARRHLIKGRISNGMFSTQ